MASVSQKSLAIIGQGYVGLPLAMAAVESGWTVIGLDNSASRVENLNLGQSPVEDISNETFLNYSNIVVLKAKELITMFEEKSKEE